MRKEAEVRDALNKDRQELRAKLLEHLGNKKLGESALPPAFYALTESAFGLREDGGDEGALSSLFTTPSSNRVIRH